VRAILLASARAHRTPDRTGRTSTAIEGLGTLSVQWANWLMDGRAGRLRDVGGYGLVDVTATQAGACWKGDDATIELRLRAGRPTRVLITWNSVALAASMVGPFLDRRKSDLDLVITDATTGKIVNPRPTREGRRAASNVEWVDFTPKHTGRYTARVAVSRWDCDLPNEPVGWAWVSLR
jgi:hypothetical protein